MAKIRLVNKHFRGWHRPGEVAIDICRPTVLGNSHYLHDPNNLVERKAVIDAYRADLDNDFKFKGSMHKAVMGIVAKLEEGNDVALLCWCHPKPCHGDVIIEKVKQLMKI